MGEATHYAYRVIWSDEDGEFVGLCAEFPSLSWLAKTQAKALAGIVRLVEDILKDMAPSEAPEPLAARQYSGEFRVRIPPEVHRRLVIEAAESKVSLNRLVSAKLSRG